MVGSWVAIESEDEARQLRALFARLVDEQDMIEWLCTVDGNQVSDPIDPEATKEVRKRLGQVRSLISLTYIWALLDQSGFDEHGKWISPRAQLELKAWKHVRDTGARAPGGRAKQYYDDFDAFMTSGTGNSGLRENCDWGADTIYLDDAMTWKFFEWAKGLVHQAVSHCERGDRPGSL